MHPSKVQRPLNERISQTFIAGVLGILPLAISLAVMAWVVVFLHDLVGPQSAFGRLLRGAGLTVVTCEVVAYSLGLIGTMLFIYGLGVLVENGGGHYWHRVLDGALRRVPLLGAVYDASKNVTSVFDRRSDSLQGMTPVMCYFGSDRSAATLALMPTPDLVRIEGREYHVVILPTAPVPFGGALLCIRAENVEPAGCGLDDLVGVFMSMGVTAPRCLSDDTTKEAKRPVNSNGDLPASQ